MIFLDVIHPTASLILQVYANHMRAYTFFIPRIPIKHPKFFANLLQNSPHRFSEQLLKIHCSSSLVFALSETLQTTDLDDNINELLIAKIKETVYIYF